MRFRLFCLRGETSNPVCLQERSLTHVEIFGSEVHNAIEPVSVLMVYKRAL